MTSSNGLKPVVSNGEREKVKFGVFNFTQLKTEEICNWIKECLCVELPDFYIVVESNTFDGFAITNINRPTIVILFENEEQFKRVLKHEFIHLKQHQKGYANEFEAYVKNEELEKAIPPITKVMGILANEL